MVSRTSRHHVFSSCRVSSFQSERTSICDDVFTATTDVSIGYNEDAIKKAKCDVGSGVMKRQWPFEDVPALILQTDRARTVMKSHLHALEEHILPSPLATVVPSHLPVSLFHLYSK